MPCGPVYRMDEVFADPQVGHLEMTAPVAAPGAGPAGHRPQRGADDRRRRGTVRAPSPERGAHTGEVLAGLGYPAAEIERLRADGVI